MVYTLGTLDGTLLAWILLATIASVTYAQNRHYFKHHRRAFELEVRTTQTSKRLIHSNNRVFATRSGQRQDHSNWCGQMSSACTPSWLVQKSTTLLPTSPRNAKMLSANKQRAEGHSWPVHTGIIGKANR